MGPVSRASSPGRAKWRAAGRRGQAPGKSAIPPRGVPSAPRGAFLSSGVADWGFLNRTRRCSMRSVAARLAPEDPGANSRLPFAPSAGAAQDPKGLSHQPHRGGRILPSERRRGRLFSSRRGKGSEHTQRPTRRHSVRPSAPCPPARGCPVGPDHFPRAHLPAAFLPPLLRARVA